MKRDSKGRWKKLSNPNMVREDKKKLTDSDVYDILILLFAEEYTVKQVAKMYDITARQVYRIQKGQQRKHVYQKFYRNRARTLFN